MGITAYLVGVADLAAGDLGLAVGVEEVLDSDDGCRDDMLARGLRF